jgi:alcohol dehydrogenase
VAAIADQGARRVFMAIDAALVKGPVAQSLLKSAASNGMEATVFSDIEPDPSDITVTKAFERARSIQADAVVAFGGGSTIDVAKAVAILSTNGGRIHDYEGIEKFSIAPLPLIAIPSTAGTGSEVSGSCVITETTQHRKMSIRHASLNPARVAILDPSVLESMPSHVALHSGMDAFVHALESFISLGANPFTDALNLNAIRLISANLGCFVANRANHAAAESMLIGSALAGMSFGLTGLGNVHCLARFIGAQYGLSHGLSNAVCLPHVAEFNRLANPAKFAQVAEAMGEDVRSLSTVAASERAVYAIGTMCSTLGIPSRLHEVGAKEEDLDGIAGMAFDAGYNRWNPRHTTKADFLALLKKAF